MSAVIMLRTIIFFVFVIINSQASASLKYIELDDWGFNKLPTFNRIQIPSIPQYVVITDTNTQICTYDKYCSLYLNYIVDYESYKNPEKNVTAHFYIGGDGHIYEGRGWNFIGGNNFGCDDNTPILEISFIGNFKSSVFPIAQFKAANELIRYAVQNGKLSENYKLFGGWQLDKDIKMTDQSNIRFIETWPCWSDSNSICSDGFSNFIPIIY